MNIDLKKYKGFYTCQNIEESILYIVLVDPRWYWPNRTLEFPRTPESIKLYGETYRALKGYYRCEMN